MTALAAAFAASLAVLASDRMAMADRQFDRGEYAAARAEYAALDGADGIAADELLYRLAECDRALGDKASARRLYGELLDRFPLSRHASRSRLQRALAASGPARLAELRLLDTDATPSDLRASALYHIGVAANDADAFSRCVKLAPKGPYAAYAKFRHASLVADDPDPSVRRNAIGELMEIHFSRDRELGREALYLAATRSYADRRHGEASSLFRRYLRFYPDDPRAGTARDMAAWSDYLAGKYADAAALCGDGRTDDTAYLLGACAYASGDRTRARELMTRYLEDFPDGRYRRAVELPLARMEFDAAEKGDDAARAVEAAKRSAALSGAAADRIRLAWAYERAGREDDAAAEYAAVAGEFPATADAAEALFRKAMIDARARRWSPAELALSEALATGRCGGREGEALYWRGVAATMLGHAEEGAAFLRDALDRGISLDQSREARLMLADAAFNAERLDEAKSAYAKLVAEGACDRMSAAKARSVGRFLLDSARNGDTLDAAKTCARSMAVHADTPEWRQSAYALMGAAEEAAGEYSAAMESYGRSMAEKVRTEDARAVSLALGVLQSKAGLHGDADRTLKEAVSLNAADPSARAKAYLWLAKNSEAMTDFRSACAYATVVTTLFDDAALASEAGKILKAHPEDAR